MKVYKLKKYLYRCSFGGLKKKSHLFQWEIDQKELRKSLWKLVLLSVLLPSNEVCFLPPAAEFPITVPNSLEKVANRLKRFPCKSCFCNFAHCCGHRALFLHKNCRRFQESEHLLVADKLDLHMLRASQNLGRIVHSAEEKSFKM